MKALSKKREGGGFVAKFPTTPWKAHWCEFGEGFGWVSRWKEGVLIQRKRYYKTKQAAAKEAAQANRTLKGGRRGK